MRYLEKARADLEFKMKKELKEYAAVLRHNFKLMEMTQHQRVKKWLDEHKPSYESMSEYTTWVHMHDSAMQSITAETNGYKRTLRNQFSEYEKTLQQELDAEMDRVWNAYVIPVSSKSTANNKIYERVTKTPKLLSNGDGINIPVYEINFYKKTSDIKPTNTVVIRRNDYDN